MEKVCIVTLILIIFLTLWTNDIYVTLYDLLIFLSIFIIFYNISVFIGKYLKKKKERENFKLIKEAIERCIEKHRQGLSQ